MNGQDARSTRKSTLCGTGILPVLENGARCELKPTKNSSIATGFDKISLMVNRQHLKIGK
jgi:hypothetical protein